MLLAVPGSLLKLPVRGAAVASLLRRSQGPLFGAPGLHLRSPGGAFGASWLSFRAPAKGRDSRAHLSQILGPPFGAPGIHLRLPGTLLEFPGSLFGLPGRGAAVAPPLRRSQGPLLELVQGHGL